MKPLVVLFVFTCFFYSCSPEESPSRTDENLIQNLSVGQWRIGSLLVNGINQTSEFDGYNFVFYPGGQSEVFRGTQLLGQGTWNTTVQGGRIQLQLSFSQNSQFEVLNGEWFQAHIVLNRIKITKESQGSLKELILQKL